LSAEDFDRAIRTRLLDQCALDEARLTELCSSQSDHTAELARLERKLATRRFLKNLPVVGPAARGVYQRIVRARRFGR
jgi:hypothetical protein